MKYFTKLKIRDIISLIGLIILGFAWIMIDQLFLSKSGQRFIAFSMLMILLFYLQYVINKPDIILKYANSLAVLVLVFVILSSIVTHVIIHHDFAEKFKHSLLIWVITGSMPYLVGMLYALTRKKRSS